MKNDSQMDTPFCFVLEDLPSNVIQMLSPDLTSITTKGLFLLTWFSFNPGMDE